MFRTICGRVVLAVAGLLATSATPGQATVYYRVTGGYGYNGFYQSQVGDTGEQPVSASLMAGGSDLFGGGFGEYSGSARANSLHAYAGASANPQNSSQGFGNVSSTLEDDLTFDYGSGSISTDPIAIEVTLYLDSHLALALLPGSARVTGAFSPAGNTSYFNSGLTTFDALQADNSGNIAHTGVFQQTTTYYVPVGAAFNYIMTLGASAGVAVGYDYQNNRFLGNNAAADASHTGYLGIRVMTPGAVLHSASGANYTVAGVPEPASWALMVGGFGLMGAALRRRQRVTVAFA